MVRHRKAVFSKRGDLIAIASFAAQDFNTASSDIIVNFLLHGALTSFSGF
jgi:hypothetical protein